MTPDVGRYRGASLLLLLAGLAYAPLLLPGGQFLDLDDRSYVLLNQHVNAGFSISGLRWAFGITSEVANWHPLTWLSHMLDCQIFALHVEGHHLTSVLLHLLNGALVLSLARKLDTGEVRAQLLCSLWLLHPMHVESVAWIAERKNVLCMTFALLALVSYLSYVRRPNVWSYTRVTLFLALGLLSKPMVVTLPFVFLLLDWVPLGRLRASLGDLRLWLEKLPWLAMSALCSVLTVIAQGRSPALRSLAQVPFWGRLGNALYAYKFYVVKLLWPCDLYALYRRPPSWSMGQLLGAGAVLMGVSAFLLLRVRRRPFALVGWCWFLGTLVPVIGLVQVGDQFAADRYVYLPAIGFWIALLWSIPEALWAWAATTALRPAAATLLGLALVLCSLTARLSLTWRSPAAFHGRIVRLDPLSPFAHAGLADALIDLERGRGPCDLALSHLREALRLSPTYADAHMSVAVCLGRQGQTEAALASFGNAVVLRPGVPHAQESLEEILAATPLAREVAGALTRALAERLLHEGLALPSLYCYQRAVELDPNDELTHRGLAYLAGRAGDHEVAALHMAAALKVTPDDARLKAGLQEALRRISTGRTRPTLPARYRSSLSEEPR